MLILLPPSEKKRIPESGPLVDLHALSFAKALLSARTTALETNRQWAQTPCAEAINIYSGVLYQALDWSQLDLPSQKRAQESIVIISALFGALRPLDLIPYYKEKITPVHWKTIITATLSELHSKLIVDARSSTYSSVWTPPPANTVGIRVHQIRQGEKTVITHMSKKTRGDVTRLLVSEVEKPQTPDAALAIIRRAYSCELIPPSRGKSWFIDVIAE